MALLGWPYVEGPSAWGGQTSTLNFCEKDYYMVPYIAEFINTISNILYLYLAFYGLRNATRNQQHGLISYSYVALSLVGFGSIVFHATMKFTTQMIDELVMIYATASVLYAVYGLDIRPKYRYLLGAFLLISVITITLVHYAQEESALHQLIFGAMIVGVFFKCAYLMRLVKDKSAKAQMQRLCLAGTATFLSGYMVWLTDENFCSYLRDWRDVVGMPLGFLLELHGWWHILTAHGVYSYMVFVEFLTAQTVFAAQGGNKMVLKWDWRVIPYLVKSDRSRGQNGHVQNGHVQKGHVQNGHATNGHIRKCQ